MWTYERNKTPEGFERLLSRIRDGHMSVPLNALVSTYGAQPAEAVLREMYYPGRIERRHGVRFPIAIAMEDQTLPYGLGALWAGSGARYSWKGICGCATRIRKNERRPQAVELVDSDPEFRSLHPYPVIGVFGKGWDDLKTLTDEFVTVARSKTNDARTVSVSDQLDFFRDFESSHGAELPTMSVGFGNEWDLYSASLAEVSARVRRAVERLRAAEGLATLVALERPGF
jgi:alpha-mannosidase